MQQNLLRFHTVNNLILQFESKPLEIDSNGYEKCPEVFWRFEPHPYATIQCNLLEIPLVKAVP